MQEFSEMLKGGPGWIPMMSCRTIFLRQHCRPSNVPRFSCESQREPVTATGGARLLQALVSLPPPVGIPHVSLVKDFATV